jgi:hypothetical protein
LKDINVQWETDAKKTMAMLKEDCCNAPVLKTLDVSDGTWLVFMNVDYNFEGWGAIL